MHLTIDTEVEFTQLMCTLFNNEQTDIDDYDITFGHFFVNSIHIAVIADMIRFNRTIKSLKLNISSTKRKRPTREEEKLIADALLVNSTIKIFEIDVFNYPLVLQALRHRYYAPDRLVQELGRVAKGMQKPCSDDESEYEDETEVDTSTVACLDDADDEGEKPVWISPMMLMIVASTMQTTHHEDPVKLHLDYLTGEYEKQRLIAAKFERYHYLVWEEKKLWGSYTPRCSAFNDRKWLEESIYECDIPECGKSKSVITEEDIRLSKQRREEIREIGFVHGCC
jgi:hypothetical protein